MNKRGFELVWSTIVIIILAFMLLLFIVLFFTTSSGSFVDRIKSYFSYSNVDSVVQGCNVLADSGSGYVFCCEKKIVKYYSEGEKREGEFSCGELIDESFIDNRINNLDCGGVSCWLMIRNINKNQNLVKMKLINYQDMMADLRTLSCS